VCIEEHVESGINQKNIDAIIRIMIAEEHNIPLIKSNFKKESVLWDYKADVPFPGKQYRPAWAEIAVDILAFHNVKGGILLFGIRDSDFSFCGCTHRLDSKLFNDQIRGYLGDRIWVDFMRLYIQEDQRYLGVALIPRRSNIIGIFKADAPAVSGKKRFEKGFSAIRKGDSSFVINREQTTKKIRESASPALGKQFYIDEPFFRILQPEYEHFVFRKNICDDIMEALVSPRTAITSLIGIGGVGKTALATWATVEAHKNKLFEFIVSITAKDRELTSTGIKALNPKLTTYESLLDEILLVLGFPEQRSLPIKDKEKSVNQLIENSEGLIFVDNLETVDDVRVIEFLDNLPVGVRGITTSRRTRVRVSTKPIDPGPFKDDEVLEFINNLGAYKQFAYVGNLLERHKLAIGKAADGLPLAIKWVLMMAKTPDKAISIANSIKSENLSQDSLLEFCFRRIFDDMDGVEKTILYVLTLFEKPIHTEAILVGANIQHQKAIDSLEDLIADALVKRVYDPSRNDYCYAIAPIARQFIFDEISRQSNLEQNIRKRLSDWYEARDIKDAAQRIVEREIRQGRLAGESGLLDLALAAEKRKDYKTAENLYEQELRRNPTSWKAARLYGEYCRHITKEFTKALRYYRIAAAHAPKSGTYRLRIFREFGILLRDSGQPDSTRQALEQFEMAYRETKDDPILNYVMANLLERRGAYKRIIEVLGNLTEKKYFDEDDICKSLPLLLRAYEKENDLLKVVEIKGILQTHASA